MRCRACNEILSDFELTRKDKETGDFLDLCNDCAYESDLAMDDFDWVTSVYVEPTNEVD